MAKKKDIAWVDDDGGYNLIMYGGNRRSQVPKNVHPTGWGDEVYWHDEDGFIFHHPPRTKYSHPYSYDPITLIHGQTRGKKDVQAVYSDRMFGWESDKFRAAMEHAAGKKTGELNFSWSRKEAVTKFMRHYYDDETIEVVKVVEMCNASSGYPLWLIYYRTDKK